MEALKTYSCNSAKYYLITDLMAIKKGFKSQVKFIEALKLSPVYGRVCIDDESFRIDEKRSKKLSKVFISVDQINEDEIKPRANKRVDGIKLIEYPEELDSTEFCFFKDTQDIEHDVPMYGTRSKEGILFKLKDIKELFELKWLEDVVNATKSSFEYNTDFVKSKHTNQINGSERYVTFLTFKGLLKVIKDCRTGRGKEFLNYLEDIVFAAIAGDTNQRVSAVKDIIQGRLELLKEVIRRHVGTISCIYLLKTGHTHNGVPLYKYGFTKNLERRLKEHGRTYGDGLDLEYFFLIREDNLAKAEADLRACLLCFACFDSHLKDQTELVALKNTDISSVKASMSAINSRYSDSQLESLNAIRTLHEKNIAKIEMRHVLDISQNKENHMREMTKLEVKHVKETAKLEIDLAKATYLLDSLEDKQASAISLLQSKHSESIASLQATCDSTLANMKNASDALIAQIESKNNMLLEKLTSCNETYSREISLLKNKLDAKDKEIDNRDTLIAELKAQYEHLSSQGSQDLRLENETLLGQVNEMRVKLEALKVEHSALEKELEESHMRADLLQFKLASK